MSTTAPDPQLSRRSVADLLGLHPDSVSRLSAEGLACAVVRFGGHGQAMAFDQGLALRWDRARRCRRVNGKPCRQCRQVLEDCQAVGEHLLEERHGHGQCEECTPPGGLCGPCEP